MATSTSKLILSLVDQVTGPASRVQRAIKATNNAVERNNRAIRDTQGAMFGTAAAAAAAAASLSAPVRAAMRFEDAMADVRKVVDFDTPDGFKEFRAELLGLSRDIPLTVQELATLAAKGGSSGIMGDELNQYVEQAAKLGIAFDITADKAGTFMNSMRNSLGMSLDETMRLSDAVNHLTNSMAAEAPNMVDFMTVVSGGLKSAGFDAEEAAAFGAAMQATGFGADVAATSFRNMTRALTRGESATKRQSDAYAKLGMDAAEVARKMQEDAVGTTLDVIDAIGKLPEEMRASISSDLFGDEARALTGLISNTDLLREALGYVGDEADYAGSALKEYAARSKTFSSDLQRFQNIMSELSITIGEALLPALSDTMESMRPIIEAAIEWASENGELIRTIVRVTSVVVGLRLALLGLRLAGLTGKGGVLWAVANGLTAIQGAGRGLGAVTRSLSGIAGAVGQAGALQAALAKMDGRTLSRMDKLKGLLRGIAGVTGLSAVASGVAAVVGAITLPIAAVIGAVAAASYTLWKWWDKIAAVAKGVAAGIYEAHPAFEVLGTIMEKLEPVLSPVRSGLEGIGSAISTVVEKIKGLDFSGIFSRQILPESEKATIEARAREMTTNIINAVKSLPGELYDIGVEAIQSLWRGMNDKLKEVLQYVAEIPGRIVGALGSIDLIGAVGAGSGGRAANRPDAPSSENNASTGSRNRIEGRALGGPIAAGIPYLVNENTPRSEVIVPSVSGAVLNVPQARRAIQGAFGGASRGGGNMSVTVGDIIIQGGAGASAEELSEQIGRRIGLELRSHHSDAF